MADMSATLRIERASSIESEPRTLTMNQIQFAREAALYVMQTKSIEEALSIFSKGLEPTVKNATTKDKMNFAVDAIEDYGNFATHL